MLIFSLLAARSISTRDTPAWAKRFLRSFFRTMSSWRRFAYSFSAYQRLRQVLLKPEAEPDRDGPSDPLLRLLAGLALRRAALPSVRPRARLAEPAACASWSRPSLRHAHREVRRALDDLVGAAHGRRTHALLRRPLVGVGGGDDEVVLVQAPLLVLVRHVHRVGDGRAQRLLDVARHRLLGEAQDGEGVAGLLAPDEVQHQPGLLGRGADVLRGGLHFEHGFPTSSARRRAAGAARPPGRRRARPRPWPPSPPWTSGP